jgi:hypothetical protein
MPPDEPTRELTIESWTTIHDTLVVRVRLDGDVYERELHWWSDRDERDRRTAARFMAHAARRDDSPHVPDVDKAKSRAVDHALAIEAIFPELHHDSRLPA